MRVKPRRCERWMMSLCMELYWEMIRSFSEKMAWLRLSKLSRLSVAPAPTLTLLKLDLEVKDGLRASFMMRDEAGRFDIFINSTANT